MKSILKRIFYAITVLYIFFFQIVKCTLKKSGTVEDFLGKVCFEHELAPSEHFLRVKKKKEMPDSKFFVPQRSDLLDSYVSPSNFHLSFMAFLTKQCNA